MDVLSVSIGTNYSRVNKSWGNLLAGLYLPCWELQFRLHLLNKKIAEIADAHRFRNAFSHLHLTLLMRTVSLVKYSTTKHPQKKFDKMVVIMRNFQRLPLLIS